MVKMRYDGVIKNVAVYAMLGIDLDGIKSCLGLYVAETESAKYWLTIMNELKNRGVQDILIFAVDNLTGISEAIEAAFPEPYRQQWIILSTLNSEEPTCFLPLIDSMYARDCSTLPIWSMV